MKFPLKIFDHKNNIGLEYVLLASNIDKDRQEFGIYKDTDKEKYYIISNYELESEEVSRGFPRFSISK